MKQCKDTAVSIYREFCLGLSKEECDADTTETVPGNDGGHDIPAPKVKVGMPRAVQTIRAIPSLVSSRTVRELHRA
jgi:hypothetical protein